VFERKILHDGMENAYEFNKDGKRYRLEPIVEDDTTKMDSSDIGCSGNISGHLMLCFSEGTKEGKFSFGHNSKEGKRR